jgi:hypothetical protein
MLRRSAVLMSSCPWIDGAIDETSRENMLGRADSSVKTARSSSVVNVWAFSSSLFRMKFASMRVEKTGKPFFILSDASNLFV